MIVLASLLTLASISACSPLEATLARTERVLAATVQFGSYSATQDGDVDRFCKDKGINPDSYYTTVEILEAKTPSYVSDNYQQGRTAWQNVWKDVGRNSHWGTYFKDSWFPVIFPMFIIIGVTVILLFFFIFWFIFRDRCCVQKKEDMAKNSKLWFFSILGLVILGVVSMGLIAAWAVYAIRTVNTIPAVKCLVYHLHGRVNIGVKSDKANFIGLKGIQYTIGQIVGSMSKIPDVGAANADAVINAALPAKAVDMRSGYSSFVSGINPEDYLVKSPRDPAMTYTADLLMNGQELFRKTLQQEINDLNSLAVNVDKAAKLIKNNSVDTAAATNSFNSLFYKLDTVILKTDQLKRFVTTNVDADAVSQIAIATVIVTIACMFVFWFIFMVILYLNVEKNSCLCGKYINYLILIITTLFLIALSIYATASIMLSQSLNLGCDFIVRTLKDYDFNLQMNPQNLNMKEVIEQCVGPRSKGDLSSLIPSSTSYEQLNTLVSQSAAFEALKANITSTNTFGKLLQAQIQDKLDLKVDDSASAGTNGLASYIDYFNQQTSCARDEYRYVGKCTAGNTVSLTGHTFDQSLNQGYCMEALAIPTHNFENRYSTVACVTDSSIKAAGAANPVKKLVDSITDYRAKFTTFKTRYDTALAKQNDLVTALNSVKDPLTALSNAFSGPSEISRNFGGPISSAFNCSTMRDETIATGMVICTELGPPFILQTILVVWMSVVFFFYIICMFCGLRARYIEEVADKGPGDIYKVDNDENVIISKREVPPEESEPMAVKPIVVEKQEKRDEGVQVNLVKVVDEESPEEPRIHIVMGPTV